MRESGCLETRLQQLVVGGLASQGDGVVGGFSAITPSVEDGENERMLGYLARRGYLDFQLGFHLKDKLPGWGAIVSRLTSNALPRIRSKRYLKLNKTKHCHPERSAAEPKDLRFAFDLALAIMFSPDLEAVCTNDLLAYIVASRSHTLYLGVTGNLLKRIFEHKQKNAPRVLCKIQLQPTSLVRAVYRTQ